VYAIVLLAILLALLHKRSRPVKISCPKGYMYSPSGASGSACIPIGITSSEAGVSSDATRPQVYDTPMFPANRPSDEYYMKFF